MTTEKTTEKLRVEGIVKRFGTTEVLKDVSVTAHAGDVISVIGSSGSGKSTLLRCINLLERPNAGRIVVAGEEVMLKPGKDGALHPADPKQLQRVRSRLAMVFQHFNLWAHMTALANVIEAPMQVLGVSRAEATERAEALLARVGVAHRKAMYPSQLSVGEIKPFPGSAALSAGSTYPEPSRLTRFALLSIHTPGSTSYGKVTGAAEGLAAAAFFFFPIALLRYFC